MRKSILPLGLSIAIQVVILLGVIVNAALPIWTGRDLQFHAEPIDPRDLLRGQYARLEYAFTRPSDLPGDLPTGQLLAYGTPVYIVLRDSAGWGIPVALRQSPPGGDTLFLRGQLASPQYAGSRLHLEVGLEQWYASPDEVAAVEEALRRQPDGEFRRVAVQARVAANGQARIVGLTLDSPAAMGR